MYKRILVPLDGSKRAEVILPHVEQLAQNFNSRVTFLQVVELPSMIMPPGQPDLAYHQAEFDRQKEKAELYLKTLQGEFQMKGIQAAVVLDQGSVVGGIIETANRHDVDLIAMASHGRSGLAQVFYGSVAAGVLHRVDRPLLLIRAQT